jgi:hypothetical protein
MFRILVGVSPVLLSARLGVVYTAENDPNQLFGRPSGYASKVSFTDTRVEQNKAAVGPRSRLAPGCASSRAAASALEAWPAPRGSESAKRHPLARRTDAARARDTASRSDPAGSSWVVTTVICGST